MNKKNIAAVFAFSVLLIAGISCIVIKNGIEKPLNSNSKKVVDFEIKQGEGVRDIADNLEKNGLITGEDFFKIYLWKSDFGSKLKAGTYQISPKMNIPQMVDIFTHGESGFKSNEIRVVVTEGSSDRDILDKLRQAGLISDNQKLEDVSINLSGYNFLSDRPADSDLQGYLFPDTYNFYKDASLADIMGKMLDNFDKKLTDEMRQDIRKQNKNVHDIIIMASIIEKESPDKEDMPVIAGVFYNRLDVDMPLQSDATINYITGDNNPTPTGEDIAVDSPYNTYKNKGLPPAPICNPGIEAIKAAIYPAKTDYMYFLMAQNGERKTVFSKTYEEHLQNKAKYLK